MQRYSPLNSSIGLKGLLLVKAEIVEFNPPPAMSSNGKPEPASSVDANGAFFVEGHGSSSLPSLLSEQARRCGRGRRRGARCKYVASDRIHIRHPYPEVSVPDDPTKTSFHVADGWATIREFAPPVIRLAVMGTLPAPELLVACDRSNRVPRELNELVERRFGYALHIAVGAEVCAVIAGQRWPDPIRLDTPSA